MLKSSVVAAAGFLTLALAAPATAGVILTENLALTATWPETVDISTRNPSLGSSGNSTSATSTVAQSFTAPESGYLDTLYFVYTGGAGTYKISLFTVADANSLTLTPTSADLYDPAATSPLTFTGTTSVSSTTGAILKLSFNGDDRVWLTSGGTYAVQFSQVSGGGLGLRRTGSSTYPGGIGYVNTTAVNSPAHRDWGMAAIITVPEPSAALLATGAVALFAGRRRRQREQTW